jgi:hypothetical protein
MIDSEVTNNPIKDRKVFTVEQTIEYLTDSKRDPVLQVVGEYIRAAEGGEFDEKRVLKNIRRHLVNIHANGFLERLLTQPKVDIKEFFNSHLGYLTSMSISSLYDSFVQMPDEVKAFLEEYSQLLNTKIETTYQQTLQKDQVLRIVGILSLMVNQQPIYRPLRQYERDRFVQEEFQRRTGQSFKAKLDAQHPVYRRAIKQSDFMTVPEFSAQREQVTLAELKNMYIRLIKELYDDVMFRTDPTYNPLQTTFSEDQQITEHFRLHLTDNKGKKPFLRDELSEMIADLRLTEPDFYLEATSRMKLTYLLYRYIDNFNNKEEWTEVVEDIKNAKDDLVEYLCKEEKVDIHKQLISSFLGGVVAWIHRTEKHVWQVNPTKEGVFGKTRNGLELLALFVKELKTESFGSQVFSDFGLTDQELTGLFSFMKDMFKVNVSLSGNPLHVVRFPGVVSVFRQESVAIAGSFLDYKQFMSDRNLQSRVQARSHIGFTQQEHDDSIYLALPQYAPVAEITVFAQDDAGKSELTEGQDYQLQYEPKTGHYRIQLLSVEAKVAGKKGIQYVVGLDFIDQQKDVPKKVNTVELSAEKVKNVCEALQSAGFGRLAERLQRSLQPTLLKRMRLQFAGKEFQYSSDEVVQAVRESVYYSYATQGSEEVAIANKIVSNAVDNELDFSFLPQVAPDRAAQARIRVQCRHVAKLYSEILNYLLIDNKDKQGQTYESDLFADPTGGVTGMMGFKVFTFGHSDTQGVIINASGETQRFDQDLTPGPSVGTAVDAVRSALTNIQQIISRLTELKKSLDGDLSATDRFYIEIQSNEKSFDQYIRELKREAAEYSHLFRDRQKELDTFVHAEPGVYRPTSELMDIMKDKPLAAVVNIILFFQEHGNDFIHRQQEVGQIKHVLSTLVEWFQQVKAKEPTQNKSRESDRVFLDELSNASRIAEKLLLLIESNPYLPN